jgi:hypothetical protein
VVIHLDDAEPEVTEMAEASGHEVISSHRQVGIGGSVNRILELRQRGQDFFRLDGDTELVTKDWLAKLYEALPGYGSMCPTYQFQSGGWAQKAPFVNRAHIYCGSRGTGIGAAALFRGIVLDTLGAFRTGVPWSFEDSDYYRRMYNAGWKPAMSGAVLAREASPPLRQDTWRRRDQPGEDPDYRTARAAWEMERTEGESMAKIMTKTVYARDARGRSVVLRPGDAVPEGVRLNPGVYTEDAKEDAPESLAKEVRENWASLTKARLVEMAKARGLPVSGNKQDLIKRLGDA